MTGTVRVVTRSADFPRREFLKAGGALVIGFSMSGFLTGEALGAQGYRDRRARRGRRSARSKTNRYLARHPCRQHRDGLHRLRRAWARLDDIAAANRGRGARPGHEPGQHDSPGHEHHAESRRHVFELVDRSRKSGNPYGGRRGAPGIAAACFEKTRRAGRAADGISKGVVSVMGSQAKRAPSLMASWSATSLSA